MFKDPKAPPAPAAKKYLVARGFSVGDGTFESGSTVLASDLPAETLAYLQGRGALVDPPAPAPPTADPAPVVVTPNAVDVTAVIPNPGGRHV